MATGYTYEIQNGISFEKFVLDCARAFGPCIRMRDDSKDTPIPEAFETDSYHKKELADAEMDLHKYLTMTKQEQEEMTAKYNETILITYEESCKRISHIEKSYKDMLAKVLNWNPPTEDHEALKAFMIEQISSSIKYDVYAPTPYKPISVEALMKIKIEFAQDDIEYHKREYEKETSGTAKSNKWIKDLRESLK